MDRTEMSGKTCLVTGATDGHGKAVAFELARRGADLVLLGRSREKTRSVQAEIAADCGGKAPEVVIADLASPSQIQSAILSYLGSGRRLDVLVNNAGLVSLERRVDEGGHELTFAVNYLAMVRLTLGLLPALRRSAPARIVNIASDTYRLARIDFADLQMERGYSLMKAYGRSKLAIVYFTLELAERLEASGISVNAVDPGPVASNIGANNEGLAYKFVGPLIRGLFPSGERAARTTLRVACAPELEGKSGGYYRSMKRRKGPLGLDAEVRDRLWEETLSLCGPETREAARPLSASRDSRSPRSRSGPRSG